ncbi:hypothetical protein B0H66DRAFT_23495 [Apodospora peruviana]|uniref:RRM domain-containing protein n=1 Tax=Apodospora peruviana TaxID=516989 RepID=A0AAE0IQH1_9PEZI|nr:hypothetical protein B0H66DRAFT_23495 [Apodospora peruviana]
MADEKLAEYWTFPTNRDEFNDDDRISYSKLDNKYIAVQEDGTEYEFDDGLKRWIPIVDEELFEQQQKGYMMAGVNEDDHNDDGYGASAQQGKKRKNDFFNDQEDNSNHARSAKQTKKAKQYQPKKNSAVYVTGLPLDTTVEEVAAHFSKKCGVIAEEIDSGRPRIKLYKDENGNFKGDALVVFFKPESVDQAILLLHENYFRYNSSGMGTDKIRVEAADLSYKKTVYDSNKDAEAKPKTSTFGSNDSADVKRANKDKAKIIKKSQKLEAKLSDWDDDEPSNIAELFPNLAPVKSGKVVILQHMFTLEELEEDPAALLDIKDDIRQECEKLGPVTNIVLYDQEEEGIVKVKFQSPEAAEACVRKMHGRHFDKRVVKAYYATGKEKFQKSKSGGDAGDQDED